MAHTTSHLLAIQVHQLQRQESLPECSTAGQQQPAAKDGGPTRAAGAENTSPATLLRAVEQLDAKLRTAATNSPCSRPGGRSGQPAQQRQRQRPAAQQPVLRQLRQAAGGARSTAIIASNSSTDAPASSSDELQAELQHSAAAEVPPAVDPLEQLLQELLAAEGAGDPHSIINLYVAEQLQLQAAAPGTASAAAPALAVLAAAAPVSAAPHAGPQRAPQPQVQAFATASHTQPGHGNCIPIAVESVQPAAEATAPEVHIATALMHQAPAASMDQAQEEPALAKEVLLLKEQPSLKLQPSESAPSTARHRRSSSLMLPLQLDLAAAAEPAEWSIGACGPGGAELPATCPGLGSVTGMPAAAMPPPLQQQATQSRQSAPAADTAPLEEQPGGSKQLYVQQWLQRSVAELAAPESAPAGSSAGYSEDLDQVSAPQDTLSSLPSPAAGMAPPPAPIGTAANAERLPPSADAIGAAAAATSPEAGAGAAAAAPSGASVDSRSVSAVTSMRRPGAPEPPSSSSQLDGSSCAPSRIRDAAAPAGLVAAAAPAAMAAQLEEPQAAADGQSLSSSSCDGSSAAGSELPEALSFSQLQAVGVVDTAAVLPTAGAAHVAAAAEGTVDERCDSPCSSVSPRSGAPPTAGHAMPSYQATASPVVSAPAAAAAGPQYSSAPSSQAYSSDFDSDFEDAEISYGDLGGTSSPATWGPVATAAAISISATPQPMPAAALAVAPAVDAAAAAEDGSWPSSPLVLPLAMWQAGGGSPPSSAGLQQRPRSPHHAALDDRYPGSHPGSPPSSAGSPALQLPVPGATYGRSLSPASRGGSPRASGDGGLTSRPTSPGSAAAAARTAQQAQQAQHAAAAPVAEAPTLEQEDTVIVHSPADSNSSKSSHGGQAGSPYSLLQFETEPASVAAADEAAAAARYAAAAGAPPAAVGSPPGTPVVASPGEDYGSCPGSARVDDDTVVQTGGHMKQSIAAILPTSPAVHALQLCTLGSQPAVAAGTLSAFISFPCRGAQPCIPAGGAGVFYVGARRGVCRRRRTLPAG